MTIQGGGDVNRVRICGTGGAPAVTVCSPGVTIKGLSWTQTGAAHPTILVTGAAGYVLIAPLAGCGLTMPDACWDAVVSMC